MWCRMKTKWVVIYIVHGEAGAEAARALMDREGFLCRIEPIAKGASGGEACYEVLALPTEAQEARDTLQENGF